jgi:hypothetical protein
VEVASLVPKTNKIGKLNAFSFPVDNDSVQIAVKFSQLYSISAAGRADSTDTNPLIIKVHAISR